MADTQETIADIIAEMRRGTRLPGFWRSCDLNKILQYHADRIEAAHRREVATTKESLAVGNSGDCAKLREALEALMIDFDSNYADDDDIASWCNVNVEIVRKARAALAATEKEGGNDGR